MTGAAAIAAANARRADDVIAGLVRHGVDVVFVCPGSRSTPLVLALDRQGLRTEVLLDERVAGFAALGAGRVGQVAAVVTTSGTAVANLLPACAEAARDGVPLVCVTADRSDADVAAGASQSLAQPPLLAGCVRVVVDLPASDGVADVDVAAALDDALAHLVGVGAGPVHLNVRFDKPLEPPPGWQSSPLSSSSLSPAAARRSSSPASSPAAVSPMPAGVVVVGALSRSMRVPVVRLVARLGWPAIVDVASGMTVPSSVPRLPTVALRSAAVREALSPAGILWLGGLMTEDVTVTWVAGLRRRGARVVQVRGSDVRRDPFGLMDEVHVVEPAALEALGADWPAPDATLVDRVARLAAAVNTSLSTVGTDLDEPGIARLVAQAARPGALLFIGNSMPIRDVDRFGAVLADDVDVIVNRGVAGIDGNLATALGASLASHRPGLVLLGDLAALHDLSGLAAIASARAPLRVVVVNNAGGGIFSFLPVEGAVDAGTHERFWGTPHGHALAPVARALGLAADVIDDVDTLRRRLAAPITGPELIEVRTNRADNVTRHRELDRAVESACARALS